MTHATRPPAPDQLLGNLFADVQLSGLFSDSKTFVDCLPKLAPDVLLALYETEKARPGFDLNAFIRAHFIIPVSGTSNYVSDTNMSAAEHIDRLWKHLTRPADVADARDVAHGDSRVPLPFPYVVPGGRFNEIFYWDSYFTMLGLKETGRIDLMWAMLDNFAHLIDQFGYIPNGNRTYFLSRSQPPFFVMMVRLLGEVVGPEPLIKYLPQLQKEYDFWMQGADQLTESHTAVKRVVRTPGGGILNRYWDDTPRPRPEAYREEIDLTKKTDQLGIAPETLYTHIRAACESGWDFSSRWFADDASLTTIRAANVVPIDLNVLLYELEVTLSLAYECVDMMDKGNEYILLAINRLDDIQFFFWDDAMGYYFDCDLETFKPILNQTLAGVFPLFSDIATPEQAACVHNNLKADFLQAGGWVTTLNNTGQQWDWPNGWAPLQWIVYTGLKNYGFADTARTGRDRWLALNDKVFKATGKMMEKYNVVDAALTTGGGEYPNQDGFGWTNGVYLALAAEQAKE